MGILNRRKAPVAPVASETSRWLAHQTETWEIDRLKPYANNARTHSKAQIEQIRASLREYGWTMPILAREDGTIIAGHGRLEAAIAEGMKQIPVIVARGWTEQQCRAYAIADNKIALNSGWDDALLTLELSEVRDLGLDLSSIGFSDKELDRLFPDPGAAAGGGNTQIDKVFQILIECTDEAEQLELLERLQGDNIKCKALIA